MSPPGPICASQLVPASQDRFRRISVKRCGFHDPECLPSTGAPSGPACAGYGGARHRSRGFAACESASGDPLRLLLNSRQVPARAAPLRRFARKLHSLRSEAFAPNVRQIGCTACQLLQSLRFLSTTVDVTITPRALPGVTPLHCSCAGSVASFDASLAEPSWVQGLLCTLQCQQRLPAPKRGSFAPTSISPDTSCHEPVSTPGGEPDAEVMGQSPHKLAGGRREAVRARAAFPDLPRRRTGFAHPRCLPSMGSPEGLAP
jgi:hypothetical protein